MPVHGEFDPQSNKWFCSYWMSHEEWEDIHDYAPPNSISIGAIASADYAAAEHSEKEEEELG